jgi:hypothetical protein
MKNNHNNPIPGPGWYVQKSIPNQHCSRLFTMQAGLGIGYFFKEFHTSLFLVLSTLKNFYIDPSIEFKIDFWLLCGKYTLGIETGL